MSDQLWAGIPSWYVTSQLGKLSHTSLQGRKLSTSLAEVKAVMSSLPGGREHLRCHVIPYGMQVPAAVRGQLQTAILHLLTYLHTHAPV